MTAIVNGDFFFTKRYFQELEQWEKMQIPFQPNTMPGQTWQQSMRKEWVDFRRVESRNSARILERKPTIKKILELISERNFFSLSITLSLSAYTYILRPTWNTLSPRSVDFNVHYIRNWTKMFISTYLRKNNK